MRWLKRFGLHLAAAVGATAIFVGAAAVGANQTREQVASVAPVAGTAEPRPTRPPTVRRPTPAADAPRLGPERSVAGTIREVVPGGELMVQGVGGRQWRVAPATGALVRLNGKTTKLDALAAGDSVVILGQAELGQSNRFLAHAITARRK